jgi:hypothetical protein
MPPCRTAEIRDDVERHDPNECRIAQATAYGQPSTPGNATYGAIPVSGINTRSNIVFWPLACVYPAETLSCQTVGWPGAVAKNKVHAIFKNQDEDGEDPCGRSRKMRDWNPRAG